MPSGASGRRIWPIKGFYFLFFAALASLIPFLALYYQQIGLGGRQIGVLTAIPPLVTLVAASLWGALADMTRQHRRLLAVATAGTILAVLSLYLANSFWVLLLLVVAFAFFMAPIIPLVDNSTLEALGDRKERYGRLRLWGAIGWGLSAPIVGRLVEARGLDWSFTGYAFFMGLGLLLIFGLPISQAGIGAAFWQGFRVLMGSRRWLFFLVVVFIAGLGAGIVNNYLFLYLDWLGASETLMGLTLTVATVSEMAVFAFSDRLLSRWGTAPLLMASIAAMIVRLLAYSLITVPWLVLVVQLLHGLTFAGLWVAGVSYANRAAPPGLGATAQGVFSGVTMGLASAAGALVGGWLYEGVGPLLMFRWAALGIAAAVLVAVLVARARHITIAAAR